MCSVSFSSCKEWSKSRHQDVIKDEDVGSWSGIHGDSGSTAAEMALCLSEELDYLFIIQIANAPSEKDAIVVLFPDVVLHGCTINPADGFMPLFE